MTLSEQAVRVMVARRPTMVFQPIRELATLTVVGHEALARFPQDLKDLEPEYRGLLDSEAMGLAPNVWFHHADLLGFGEDLELSAVQAALERLPEAPAGTYVAANVGPSLLVSGRLQAALVGLDLSRVVLELTEHLAIHDYGAVESAVAELQAHGAQVCTKVPGRVPGVAADDIGSGEASLNHLLRLAGVLSYAKLDIGLTRGVETDFNRQDLVATIVRMGQRSGFRVVAEGIEEPGQVVILRTLGVYAGQGWHLGRPGPFKESIHG